MTILGSQTFAADRRRTSAERGDTVLARLAAFLRTELAPSPARWRATARIVIACLVATTLAMTFRIPNTHWLIVTIFIVSQPNVGATLDKALLRLAGTIVGALGVIATVIAFPQQPWFQIPAIALLIGTSAFLSRTTTYPYVAMLGGLTVVLFLGSSAVHPTTSVDEGLWRLAAVALAEVIATAAHLLLWPDDPEDLLLKDVERVLGLVDQRLKRLLRGDPLPQNDAGRARVADEVFNGLVRHLDLLANAETRYRSLRGRHSEQLVLIGALNRIATASLTLESLAARARDRFAGDDASAALTGRVQAVADAIARLQRAIAERQPVGDDTVAALVQPPRLVGRDLPFLPSLLDMERAVAEVPAATAFLDRDARSAPRADLARSFLESGSTGFFTPACSWSNTRDLRFAAQVTIAAMICYLLTAALDWPGLSTAVVTCVIVAQSSFGATVQKALLRIAGAVVGAALGIGAILLVVPNIDTLPPFLILVAVTTTVAAYVVTGSARISYVGIQIALALALTLLDPFGPSIDLVKPRDRVVGILLGNLVTAGVAFWLWPVLAGDEMAKSLQSALKHLAALSRFGIGSGDAGQERPARGFRLQIHQDLAATLRLHAEAQFEPGAATPEHRERQRRLLALQQEVQQVFLIVAGLVRNRLNVGIGAIELPSHAVLRDVALALAPNLEAAAAELAGGPAATPPDVAQRIAAADAAFAIDAASAIELPGAAAAVVEMQSQLELYRTLAPMLARVSAQARALGDGDAAGVPSA